MFIVLLKLSDNKAQAARHMDDHKAWIKRGFDEGVFLLVGSIKPQLGGGIIAHQTSLESLQKRVDEDPFVIENVAKPEILEISPSRTDERLAFLIAG